MDIVAGICIVIASVLFYLFYNGQLYCIDPDISILVIISLAVLGMTRICMKCYKKTQTQQTFMR